jgi:hypothetical protein
MFSEDMKSYSLKFDALTARSFNTDRGFGGGDFRKMVIGEGVVFHRDKATNECRAGRVTAEVMDKSQCGQPKHDPYRQ